MLTKSGELGDFVVFQAFQEMFTKVVLVIPVCCWIQAVCSVGGVGNCENATVHATSLCTMDWSTVNFRGDGWVGGV